MRDSLINELKNEYKSNIKEVELLLTYIDKIPNTNQNERTLFILQSQDLINNLYQIKNSESLIDIQVILNEFRNLYDVTDPVEVINDEGYVQ